jgi:ribosome-binding protein aMBF1 (putative translation factor)
VTNSPLTNSQHQPQTALSPNLWPPSMSKSLVLSVASAIKHFRKEKRLSQEELADKANLDRTYISGVERGVRNITLDSLDQIIRALDVSVVEFFNCATKEGGADVHY